MAVKIRLHLFGAKKRPFYRIVVADSRFRNQGRFIEEVGYYNPISRPADIKLDENKIIKWLKQGAKPSTTVRNLLSNAGIMKSFSESKRTQNKNNKK